jgi:pentatricopeptide repeat domain-containing protein 1
LESLNKNVVDDSIIEYFLNYMRENAITPNIVSYNTVMDYYCNNHKMEKAFEIYESLKKSQIKMDNYTFTILIKGMKMMRDLQMATIDQVFTEYTQLNECRDVIIYNNFIDVFVYLGFSDKAKHVYDKLVEDPTVNPDQVTFNTLIKGSCKNKELGSALLYLEHMKKLNIKPNRITYNSLMDIAVKLQDMKHALDFLEDMRKDEITPDGYTYSIILNGLKINNSTPDIVRTTISNIAKVIETHEFKLDEVFFNSILDVCSKYEFYDLLHHYYNMMKENRIQESSVTYGILIKAYGKANDFENAQLIFEKMMKGNMIINEVTYGCILDACSKSGKMETAMKIFDSLKNSNANMNSIVFTTIIKG